MDHLQLCVHCLDDGLQVLARVGILLPRVDVRKEGEVRSEVLEVLSVVGELRREVLEKSKLY